MGNTVDIKIISAFDPKGTNAALRAAQQIQQALAATQKGAGGSGVAGAAAGLDKLAGSSRKAAGEQERTAKAAATAERAMLQQAQAVARLQQTTGQNASAQATLQGALAKTASSSKTVLSAQTQLAQLQNKGAAAIERAAKAAQQGADSSLRLAQAQARAHVAAGNLAQAESILAQAITKSGASARATIGAQAQLITIQNRLGAAAKDGASGFAAWAGPAKTAVGAIGAVAIAVAGLNSAAAALSTATSFESAMAILQANTGATADEMARAGQVAKALGSDLTLPATSAGSAALAINELVKGGLSLKEAMAAAKGTLQLAAAGTLAEADAAAIATGAINSFQLAGSQAVMVADQLAAGAAATSTDVRGMGDALEQGGGLFASYQVRVVGGAEALTQFNTAVGVLATQGVTGQKAGTYIASAMERMANPTDRAKDLMVDLAEKIGISGDIAYDAQGKMRPFEQIMQNVALATADMTDKQRDAAVATLFMTEGSKAVIPILNSMKASMQGSEISWDAIKAKTTAAGAAQAQAAAQMAGLNGAVAGLQSQVETLAQAGFEPLLPLMTQIVSSVAELAGSLAGPVSSGALALAEALTQLGTFIQSVAIPALTGLTAATIAYAVVQLPVMIAAVTAATATFMTNAAAMIAAAAPYALIAISVGLVATAYQDLQHSITSANQKMLEGKQFWNDSTQALTKYKDAQIEGSVAVKAAANTVQILRDTIEDETRALGERMTAGDVSQAQYEKEMAVINQHAAGLQQATANLNTLVEAEVRSAAAQQTATNAASQQTSALGGVAAQASLTAEDLEKLADTLADIYESGGKALADYVATEQQFHDESIARQEEHAKKLEELQAKLGDAKTAKAREAVQQEIAALQEGYAQQEQTQAESYARQQAAQNAALGQMLINYTATQVQMGNISAEQGEQIASAITEKFGIIGDNSQATFLGMAADIDAWAASGTGSAADLANSLATTRDGAVDTAQQMQALERKYVAEVLTEMQGRPPEEIAAALRAIPARVYAEVIVNERYNAATNGGTAGRQEWEREGRPRRGTGGAMAGGGRFMTDGPTTITVGDNPGGVEMVEVTPISGTGSTVVGQGVARMAGGGTLVAGGGRASAGGRANGGGGGTLDQTVSAATKAAERVRQELGKISEDAAAKLTELAENTAKKLAAIDAAAAKEQAAGRRDLYASMAGDHADMIAAMEADDMDLYVKGADKKALQQREAQQAQYRQRVEQAQDEARQIAQTDAQLAKETLAIREQAARDRMALDAQYNEAQANTSKKDKARLKKEYDEAVAAQERVTQTKLTIAQEDARQRDQARSEEQAAVVADSRTQAGEIITEAQNQAAAVEGATNQQRQAVVMSLAAQQGAADAWASAFHTATQQVIRDASAASSAIDGIPNPPSSTGGASAPSGGGGSAAAGGGTFVTDGPTTLTVGDNPGGRELVQVTPIGAKGSTRVGPGMRRMAMAGGGSLIAGGSSGSSSGGGGGMANFDLSGIDPTDLEQSLAHLTAISRIVDEAARRNKVDPGPAKKYAETVEIIAKALQATVQLRRMLRDTGEPIDMALVQPLIDEATSIGALFVQFNLGKKNNIGLLKEYGEALGAVFDVIHGIIEMRRTLQDIPPAVELNILMMLADEARQVVRVVQQQLVKLYQEEREDLAGVAEALESVVGILTNVIDLRSKLKDLGPPIILTTIATLADEAVAILDLVRNLQGLTLDQADSLKAVAEQTEHAVGIVNAMADLREKLRTPAPAIRADLVAALVREAELVRSEVLALLPPAEQTATGLEAYATAIEQAAGIVQRLAELREQLSKLAPPLTMSAVDRLAAEARRVAIRLMADAIPYAAESVAALDAYASVNEDAVAILQRMADLAKTLVDPTTPIDERLVDYLAVMARRVAIRLFADAIPYAEESAAGFDRYGQVVNGSVDLLAKIAGLGEALSKASPIDEAKVRQWSAEARTVAGIVLDDLLPVGEEQAEAFARYADAQGRSVDIVSRTASLGKDLSESQPITEAQVRQVAADGKRIVQIVQGELLPITEDEADALGRYADAQNSATSAVKSVLDLGGNLFADYVSPTDAQLRQVVTDANRLVAMFNDAAATYNTEGIAASTAFSESVGAAFEGARAGLEFFDGLRAGIRLDAGALDTFVADSIVALDALERLSARAATIPAANLQALQAAAGAISAQAEAMTTLATVPVGNLAQAGSALSNTSFGGSSTTIYDYSMSFAPGSIVISQQPGESIDALADRVAARIASRAQMRR